MGIKIKYKDPKSTDFGPNDIVINVQEGTIFYKSNNSIFKLQGDNLNTTTDTVIFSIISASQGFFATPGIGTMKLGSTQIDSFEVGKKTLEIGGSIIPSSSSSPRYDLGSLTNPWRDLYLSPSTIYFINTGKGVGFSKIENGFIIEKYKLFTDPNPLETSTTLTKENVEDLKSGKTINTVSKDLGEGDTEKTNIIFPDAIMHPDDNSTYTKYTTTGRVSQFVGGTLFFDQNKSGSNNYIAMGDANTQIIINGTITASINGGSF
jgi:hypothetical protein